MAQLLAGAARLVPTSRYLPLRLRLLRALVGLGRATRLGMPAVPLLLELLQWSALGKGLRPPASGAAGAGSGAASGGGLLLRASKALLASPAYQQDVLEQARHPVSDLALSQCTVCDGGWAGLPRCGPRHKPPWCVLSSGDSSSCMRCFKQAPQHRTRPVLATVC